jgi:hypothetical protein
MERTDVRILIPLWFFLVPGELILRFTNWNSYASRWKWPLMALPIMISNVAVIAYFGWNWWTDPANVAVLFIPYYCLGCLLMYWHFRRWVAWMHSVGDRRVDFSLILADALVFLYWSVGVVPFVKLIVLLFGVFMH